MVAGIAAYMIHGLLSMPRFTQSSLGILMLTEALERQSEEEDGEGKVTYMNPIP